MIFGVVIILIIAAIAYFHYTQGLFSATLSAICAALAAMLAFSYHETIIYSFLRGKVADYAHGMVLIALFALFYLVLRVVFDSLVPGNLRFPAIVDKVGGGAMGVCAALFATGILAIAAQELPFGPAIASYTRFKTQSAVEVQVPTQRQAEDTYANDVLNSEEPGKFEPSDASGLIVPVDDLVVGLASRLSTGALSGARPLESVHPAFLDQLFAQRMGIQVGANRVAYNVGEAPQVSVTGVFTVDQLATADSELPDIRKGAPLKNVPELLKPRPDQILLVLRTIFGRGADDSDHNVRFSAASVRLMAGGKNYHPIGTLDNVQVYLRINRLDDFVLVAAERGVDLVFVVDRSDLGVAAAAKRGEGSAADSTIGQNVFLEVKRMGVVDLAGKAIQQGVQLAENVGPFRKRQLTPPKAGAVAQQATESGQPVSAALESVKVSVNSKLFTEVNVGSYDDNSELTFGSGKATLKDKKFVKLSVNTTQDLRLIKQGEYTVAEFYAPPGMVLVQVMGKPAADPPFEPWSWADKLDDFELVDAAGTKHKPNGAWAKVVGSGGSQRMVAAYDSSAPVREVGREEGRPTDVWIGFVIPQNSKLAELFFRGKRMEALDLEVK
jgi:hypothetical protein